MRRCLALLVTLLAVASATPARANFRERRDARRAAMGGAMFPGATGRRAMVPGAMPGGAMGQRPMRFQAAAPRLASRVPAASLLQQQDREVQVRLATFFGATLLASLAATESTHTGRNPFTGRVQTVSLTHREEVQLGNVFAPSMIAANGGLYQDPVMQQYVREVGQHIVAKNGVGNLYPFRFTVLAGTHPNAFALPGGLIFITVGMLRQLSNEAALGVTLGHEILHVLGRHGSENLVQDEVVKSVFGAAFLATLGLPGQAPQLQQLRQQLELGVLRSTRHQETESDLGGVHLARQAGYDVYRGAGNLMAMLGRTHPAIPDALSDHPHPNQRALDLGVEFARTQMPEGGVVGAERYRQFVHARLGAWR